MTAAYHTPVMLRESIDGLNICAAGGVYVDATFGGGGHAREILRRLDAVGGGHLYAFDHDEEARANVPASAHLTFVHSNFRYLRNWMRYYKVPAVDGILADLGVSSHHFDAAARGFSFRYDAPLDMRMNQHCRRTAAHLLAEETEEALADIFYHYGELRMARRIAHAVVQQRQRTPLLTSYDLLRATESLFAREREKKEVAKMFQALRIAVNDELGALAALLTAAPSLLRQGGRLVVLTYHSLEDRMVKNMMKTGTADGNNEGDPYGRRAAAPLRMVTRRALQPSTAEQRDNPRARSAKLRIAEKQ